MANSTIGSLPAAATIDDASLFVLEQQGDAYHATGAQIKGFAVASVQQYSDAAEQQAANAAASAAAAAQSAQDLDNAVTTTTQNVTAAQMAQSAAEAAQTAAESAQSAAETAETNAESAKTAAETAQGKAEDAQTAAETAETNAEAAQTAAESAQSAAEQAKTDAETARTQAQTAAGNASTSAGNAASSASTALAAQTAAETAADDAEAAQAAIENLSVQAETLDTGEPASVTKSIVEGVVNLLFGLPRGATGAQGIPGNSIQSITRTSGTGAAGTTDTYTIYLTDGSIGGTFEVYNGADGTGAGDFMANGSIPMTGNLQMGGNRVTGMGEPTADTDGATKGYVDDAIEGVEITTDVTPTQGSTNPVQSGGVYTALQGKQDKLTGQQGQIVGFDEQGNAIAQTAPDTGVTTFNGRTGAVSPQSGDYTAAMVGARPDTWTPTAADVGAVPTTRTVNGHALSADITLDAEDVGARPNTWTPTAADVGAVPTSRTVNGQALTQNITLDAGDVGAVPTSRTVNGKALSSDITLTADDVGATESQSGTYTLTTAGWTQSGSVYTQSISVPFVAADTECVFVDLALSSTDLDSNNEILAAWAGPGACPVTQGNGTLTFMSATTPTINIPLNVGVA